MRSMPAVWECPVSPFAWLARPVHILVASSLLGALARKLPAPRSIWTRWANGEPPMDPLRAPPPGTVPHLECPATCVVRQHFHIGVTRAIQEARSAPPAGGDRDSYPPGSQMSTRRPVVRVAAAAASAWVVTRRRASDPNFAPPMPNALSRAGENRLDSLAF